MMLLWLYLAAVSLALFALMGIDKAAAKNRCRRIPERTLLALAVLGGSPGGLAGMLAFRHKTRKPAFALGFPAILVCQIAVGILIACQG